MPEPKTTFEQARKIIDSNISKLPAKKSKTAKSGGLVLAEDLQARRCEPAFDNSKMDGVALRFSELKAAPNNTLELRGEVAAGENTEKTAEANCAVRIMTGAPIPPGMDCVIKIEDCVIEANQVTITTIPEQPGKNIRPAGEDFKEKDLLLKEGTELTAPNLGVAILAGHAKLKVHPRPRVAILTTGDELVATPGQELQAGEIYDVNRHTLKQAVLEAEGNVVFSKHLADRPGDYKRTIEELLENPPDLIITSGGVSMGKYDFTVGALKKIGTNILFHGVWQKPGKPLAFGLLNKIPVFALPGNMVSALVNFYIHIKPALFKQAGLTSAALNYKNARVGEDLTPTGKRTTFYRGKFTDREKTEVILSRQKQGSHILTSLSRADCLIKVPPQKTVAHGEHVETIEV